MTAFLTTWRDAAGAHEEKRDTWSEAVGVQAAHLPEGATLTLVDPVVAECAHCHTVIEQDLPPGRWNDRFGDDMCGVGWARWHEPDTP